MSRLRLQLYLEVLVRSTKYNSTTVALSRTLVKKIRFQRPTMAKIIGVTTSDKDEKN